MTLLHLATKFQATVKDDGTFEGYASTFGNVDNGRDIVVKGAFTKSLSTRPASSVKMLWQHDPTQPIGVWTHAEEDSKGLVAQGKLALTTTKGRDTYELMKMGAVDGLSIGYRTVDSAPDRQTGARLLKQLDLHEISVVTFPMNEMATVTAVKTENMTEREFEQLLRDAGLPKTFAKTVVSHGFKKAMELHGQDRRDADEGEAAALIAAIHRATEALRT